MSLLAALTVVARHGVPVTTDACQAAREGRATSEQQRIVMEILDALAAA